MRKNLLIGAITNYVWDDIAPFFNSFRQAGFENCECVMFVGNMSERTVNSLESCGVNTVEIPERFNGKCVNDFRWELYRDFLNDRPDMYGMIFAADVRDAVFQQDVFKFFDGGTPFLGIALEDDILTEAINRKWLTDRYGVQGWESIKDNIIVCTGTVWGTQKEFCEFASYVTEQVNSDKYPYYNICDQAIGNWFIWHEKKFTDILRPSTNHDGYVMTIGLTPSDKIKFDSSGNVLNGTGEIAAVVHQYDRKQEVIQYVVKKYCQNMSLFAKLEMKHHCYFSGRVMRFLSRVHRKGLFRSIKEAIERRI